MRQAKPRHYLGALRAALAAAKAANAARTAAFHLLPNGVSCKMDWEGWGDPWYNATPRQQALLDVLQDLIDGGETEVPMIALKTALRLEIPESEILRSRDNVGADGETGYFFDDVMHALYALDAQDTEQVFYGLIDRLMQPGIGAPRSLAPAAPEAPAAGGPAKPGLPNKGALRSLALPAPGGPAAGSPAEPDLPLP